MPEALSEGAVVSDSFSAYRGLRLDGGGVSRRLAAGGDDGIVAGPFRLPAGMAKIMARRPPMVCGSNGVEEPLKKFACQAICTTLIVVERFGGCKGR